MAKTKLKKRSRKSTDIEIVKQPELPPATRFSDEPPAKMVKWINRQRVLVFASRGINHRHRHLMEDIKKLMPHHKPESKMERNKNLFVVNEMCEMKNCNKAMMFEGRKKKDLYMWLSSIPNGPSAKFLVENLYTMAELKFTGNCLRGSRPLLSFDPNFSKEPHLMLLKELLLQIFGVPKHHPKSQPFIDHVYTFTVLDNRIWFRNYQILSEDGALAEIGPRFVLNPVKIFSGSFGGTTLWENSTYITPSKYRQSLTKKAAFRYENRIQQKVEYEASRPDTAYPEIQNNDLFGADAMEVAKEEVEEDIKREEEKAKLSEEKVKNAVKKIKKVKAPKPKGKPNGTEALPKKQFAIKRKQFKGKGKALNKKRLNKKPQKA